MKGLQKDQLAKILDVSFSTFQPYLFILHEGNLLSIYNYLTGQEIVANKEIPEIMHPLSTLKFIDFKHPEEQIDTDEPIGTLLFSNEANTRFYLTDLFGFGAVTLGN